MTAPQQPLRILVLEDNVAHARFVRAVIEGLDAEIEVHATGRLVGACYRLSTEPFDVVIADLFLPDGQGVAVVSRLAEVAPSVPIVVVTALDDEDTATGVLAAGAHDVLIKDALTPELLGHALRRARQRSAGSDALRRSALLDPVTGVYNRPGLEIAAKRCIAFARRQKHSVTVVRLTLDDGTPAQADALARVAASTVRDADLVGRFGADTVCLVLPDDKSDPPIVLERLRAKTAGGPLGALSTDVVVTRFDPENPSLIEDLMGGVAGEIEVEVRKKSERMRALVVTEDAAVVESAAAALGDGWEVLPAVSLAPALRVCALDEPHVVIVDLALSDNGGLAVVRRISEQPETACVPIVAVSDPSPDAADVSVAYGRLDGMVDRARIAIDLSVMVARAAKL